MRASPGHPISDGGACALLAGLVTTRRALRAGVIALTAVSVVVAASSTPLAQPPQRPADAALPPGDSTRVIETFDYPERIGKFPDTWEGRSGWRQSIAEPHEIYYYIDRDNGNYFLRGETKGKAVNFGTEVDINLRLYNRLRWRWRAHLLPEGGNENVEDLNDSGAAVRLVFHGGFIPKTLKYVWSATLPVGTETESPTNGRTKVIVLRSGSEHLAEWLWEDVDAYQDYKRMFGGEPRKVQALAVITDSDNTDSPVSADYDDFMFYISPPDTTQADSTASDTTKTTDLETTP